MSRHSQRAAFHLTMATGILFLACAGSALAAGPTPNGTAPKGFTVVENGAYKPPAPPPPAQRRYEVQADVPLRQILQSWAGAEGWSVYWPASADGSDWVAEVGVSFTAVDFQQAVTKLISGLPANVGLSATFNRANSPMLLHVSESASMQEIH